MPGDAPSEPDANAEQAAEAGFEPHLAVDDVTVTRRDVEMLRAIDDSGSMSAAAEALGRSYPHLQRRVDELEAAVGSLTSRVRGGSGGGGTELTPEARRLVRRFDRLQAELAGVTDAEETVLAGDVREREGELATVETAAGRLRALVPAGADRVEVTLRSDAVTLHAPGDAPPADATSAHNRVPGTVRAVDRGEAVARVRLDVGADEPLVALVTADSADRLDLAPGREVVASFKATATRATGR